MTIKEIEGKSGLTRANIRFYEAQGLLSPQRKENGYRDYRQVDLDALLRIRLLRCLGVSLEEIKALQTGQEDLSQTLVQQLQVLEREKEERARAQALCREISAAGAAYDTLDAPYYLDKLERGDETFKTQDALPRVQAPWRRFLARMADYAICTRFWVALFTLTGHGNVVTGTGGTVLVVLLSIPLQIFGEALFLSRWGTTPGKAILGLGVQNPEGGRLTYSAGAERTLGVLAWGQGLHIPLFNLVRLGKSLRDSDQGKELPWEGDSVLTLKENKLGLRAVVFLLLVALLGWGGYALSQTAALPANRGEITVEEFCENYNLQAGLTAYTGGQLTPQGWTEVRTPTAQEGTGIIVLEDPTPVPTMTFTEENGVMTGLTMKITCAPSEGKSIWGGGQEEMAWAVLAYVPAQPGYPTVENPAAKLAQEILDGNQYTEFDREICGVKITCVTQVKEYLDAPAEDDTPYDILTFKMEKMTSE